MDATREQILEVFFKVLVPFQPKTLMFPPEFAKKYASKLLNVVTLSVPNGRNWRIGLKVDGFEEVGLHKNWREFIEHHSIDEGYFIFFKYKGDSRFDVVICDHTACEIEYPQHFVVSSDVEAEDLETIGRNSNRSDPRCRDSPSRRFSRKPRRGKANVTDQWPEFDTVKVEDDDSSKSSDLEGSGLISEKIKKKKVGSTSHFGVREKYSACTKLGFEKIRKGYLKKTTNRFIEREEECVRPKPKRLERGHQLDSETDTDSSGRSAINLKQKSPQKNLETNKGQNQNRGIKLKKKYFVKNLKTDKGQGHNLGIKLKEKYLEKNLKTNKGSTKILGKGLQKKRLETDSGFYEGSTKRQAKNLGRKSFKMIPETETDSTDEPEMKTRRKSTKTDSRTGSTDTAFINNKDKEIIVGRRFFSQFSFPREAILLAKKLNLENPSFVHVMRQHNINNACVYVPEGFVAKGLTGDFKSGKIVDPRGRIWSIQLQRKRTHAYIRGCSIFMRTNCLSAGDLCVFELVGMRAEIVLKLWVLDW